MAGFDKALIDFIGNTNLIGLKAGNERPDFLYIWMVTVEGRIFARSWGLAERSWYHTFLKDAKGELKCGERLINILGQIPSDLKEMNPKIDQAYLDKYDKGENSFYAQGIIKEAHLERTMEFIVSAS